MMSKRKKHEPKQIIWTEEEKTFFYESHEYDERKKTYLKASSYSLEGTEEEVMISIGRYLGMLHPTDDSLSKKELDFCLGSIYKSDAYEQYEMKTGQNVITNEKIKEVIEYAKKYGFIPNNLDDYTIFRHYKDWTMGWETPEYKFKYWI